MRLGDRHQGRANSLLELATRLVVAVAVDLRLHPPRQCGQLLYRQWTARHRFRREIKRASSRRTMISCRGRHQGIVRSWKPNPATG